jgi:hypothetical protein
VRGAADGTELIPRAADVALLAGAEPDIGTLRRQLAALNRGLAFGGVLAVDLLQADCSGSSGLANPAIVENELARSGFSVLQRALGGPSDVSPAMDFQTAGAAVRAPFEACWQAVKISEFIVPAEEPEANVGNGEVARCIA